MSDGWPLLDYGRMVVHRMSLFFLAGGRVFPRQRVGDVEFQLECGQPISKAGAKSSWRGGGKLLGWEVRDKPNIFFWAQTWYA